MIAVTCPAGQVPAILVPRLLRRGHPVRVLCRSSRDLDRLTALGAQVRRGDLLNRDDLDRWLREAAASFVTIPIARDPAEEVRMAHDLARAHATSEVAHLVLVSVLGCDRPAGGGPGGASAEVGSGAGAGPPPSVVVKAECEQVLADVGRDFTFLRTGLRMEILGLLPHDLEAGFLPLPVPRTALLPMVAARDIAQAALHCLARGPMGAERIGILGPALVTPDEMAGDLAAALGRQIEAIELSPAAYRDRLLGAGLSPERARHFADLVGHLAELAADPSELARDADRPPADLGEGTCFGDFARLLADAAGGASAPYPIIPFSEAAGSGASGT